MDTEQQVAEGLQRIKAHMPETYKSIQAEAARIGRQAYALVRRALRGEPNCFYAVERGHVVGTPFAGQEIERDVAQLMVRFGCAHVCIWAKAPAGGTDGAH